MRSPLRLVIGALAVLAGTACKSNHGIVDSFSFGYAFVQVAVSDAASTAASDVGVEVFATPRACAGADSLASIQHTQSDSAGQVNVLADLIGGASVHGCIWLLVHGTPTYRDTVVDGRSVQFSPEPDANLDTLHFDIQLNRAE